MAVPCPRPVCITVTAVHGADAAGEGLASAITYDIEVYDPWTQQPIKMQGAVPCQRRYPAEVKVVAAKAGDVGTGVVTPPIGGRYAVQFTLFEPPAIRACPAP